MTTHLLKGTKKQAKDRALSTQVLPLEHCALIFIAKVRDFSLLPET
jgi:hypothetical protein